MRKVVVLLSVFALIGGTILAGCGSEAHSTGKAPIDTTSFKGDAKSGGKSKFGVMGEKGGAMSIE